MKYKFYLDYDGKPIDQPYNVPDFTIEADTLEAACRKLAERRKIRFAGILDGRAYFSRRKREIVYWVGK